jgi:rubrerythrin
MSESIGGLVPLDDFIAGMRADVIGEHDHSVYTIERLLHSVERHIELVADALGQYEYLATASGDPVVALVMQLILEDEERHHGLLKRMASTLRDTLYWTHSAEALPKGLETVTVAAPEDLAQIAHALIDEEKTGAQALRNLAQREKGLDSGLDSLLLEMMALDSDKHARLLQFVHRRLEARARAAKA